MKHHPVGPESPPGTYQTASEGCCRYSRSRRGEGSETHWGPTQPIPQLTHRNGSSRSPNWNWSSLHFKIQPELQHMLYKISFNPLTSLDKTPIWEAKEQAMDQGVHWICATPATTYKTFEEKGSKQEGVQFWTSFVRIPKQVLLPLFVHLMWVCRWIRGKKKDIRISF